jgi:hypothetical protein
MQNLDSEPTQPQKAINDTTESFFDCFRLMTACNTSPGLLTGQILKRNRVLLDETYNSTQNMRIWPVSTSNHQHWVGPRWCNIYSFLTNDGLKDTPWKTDKSNLQEFRCSYLRKDRYPSQGISLCGAHPSNNTEYDIPEAISAHYPPMIAWNISPAIHTSRSRKINHVLTGESNSIAQIMRIGTLNNPGNNTE